MKQHTSVLTVPHAEAREAVKFQHVKWGRLWPPLLGTALTRYQNPGWVSSKWFGLSPFRVVGSTVLSRLMSDLMMQTLPSFPVVELEVSMRSKASTVEDGWSKGARIRQFAK